MSRRKGWGGWYAPTRKKPPPAHGIKLTKAGTTWWGQRWIEALQDVLRGDAGRLARGRTYARAGRTHDLVVAGGKITAKVTSPYKIAIQLGQLPDQAWQMAIAAMAEKAQFSAELLAGQMPKEIDDVFRAAGTSLFPKQRADLATSCSCPDWGDPCKHVAATHYVLGEALDRDPFLLFELRGRTKVQVLDALRVARGGEAAREDARLPEAVAGTKKGRAAASTKSAKPAADTKDGAAAKPRKSKRAAGATAGGEAAVDEVPTVLFGAIAPADYDRPREPLPSLHFSFDEPAVHAAVLRQLGVPPAWSGQGSPADALGSLVRRAAETARRLALAEASEVQPDDGGAAVVALGPTKRRARTATARKPRKA